MTAPTRRSPAEPVEETTPRPILHILSVAACFAFACGLLEGLVYWILSVVPDWLGWRTDLLPQILWIAPLTNLGLFLAIGLLLATVLRFIPIRQADVLAVAVFAWLATYAPLAASRKLHLLACILIASGVAVQLGRYVQRRPLIPLARLGRGVVALALLVAALSLLGATLQKRKGDEGDRATADAARPNVLLITLDTLRADHVSAYGYTRSTTPTIDRLAQEGVLFENAFATASWTLPSHASILTGRYSYEHRADGRPLDGRYPTLAEILAQNGYATAAFSANAHFVTPRAGLQRGFEHFEVYYGSLTDMCRRTFYGKALLDRLPWLGYYDIPGRKRAGAVNRELFRWLVDRPRAPFFVFLNYFDVHDPYVAPQAFATRFSERVNHGRRINSEIIPDLFTPPGLERLDMSPQDVQLEIDGYDASLAYLDAELGSLFDYLSAAGLLDNTLVILTSDHGESFGEHMLFGHGNGLYRNLIHVPLIIRFPRTVPAGRRLSPAVSLQAIPATVTSMLGLEAGSPFPGPSLARLWAGGTEQSSSHDAVAFAESLPEIVPGRGGGPMKSVATAQWQLIVRATGSVELFRVDQDPLERINVADSPEGRTVVARLGAGMEGLMTPRDWQTFGEIIAQHSR